MSRASAWQRATAAWRRVERFHDELFVAPWRQALEREARRQSDVLAALLLLESFGVDNPVAYETLDLVPQLVADLHQWHLRLGMDRLGDPGMCC